MKKEKSLFGNIYLSLYLIMSVIILCNHPGAVYAQTPETMVIISGNGIIGQMDAANKFTLDGGLTWQNAYIIKPYSSYSIITGTKYINRNPNYSGPANTSTRYRTWFKLPDNYANPSLTVKVFADNVATIFLNGVQFGQQLFAENTTNFSGTPGSFTTSNPSLFHGGINVLEFSIYNFSGPTAFDYKAEVTFTGCDNPANGHVSWWPGDGNPDDYIAYNSGSPAGGMTYVQGKADRAFKFDGTGHIAVADSDNLDISGPITLDAWVSFNGVKNFTAGSSGSPIVAKWGDTLTGSAGYGLFIDSGGYPYFIVSSTGSDVLAVKSPVPLTAGMFMHVAGIWTGTQAQLYVNGQQAASAPFSGPVHTNNVPLLIGGYDQVYSGQTDSLIGAVDEVEVYNRALSADEISAIYYAGGAGRCKVLPPAQIFADVRLLETIPAKDIEYVLSSATTTPYSVTNAGDASVIEWRFGNFIIGQDKSISFDLKLNNMIPGEDRFIEQSTNLIYNDRNNNEITVDITPLTVHILNSSFDSTVSTDKPTYQADESVFISAAVKNLSEYARTIDAKFLIEDVQGALVKEIADIPAISLSAGETKIFNSLAFAVNRSIAGNYRVHLILHENQQQVGEASTAFDILPDRTLDVNVTTDKISYTANENVTVTSKIQSMSANYIFENLTATIAVSDQQSANSLYTETQAIPMLLPGQQMEFKTYWNTSTNPPGEYPLTLVVKDPAGAVVSTVTKTFVISNDTKPSKLLKGSLTLDKQSILQGEPVNISYSITNAGNIELPQIDLSVPVVHIVELTPYDTLTDQTALQMGQTYTNTQQLDTHAYSAKDYLVILRAVISGVEETLAGTYFRVEGAPSAPSLSSPSQGVDVETLTPLLTVNNASDPNDDRLTYEFELYSDSSLTNLVYRSDMIAEGENITSWSIPVNLTENKIYYWRARAYDGLLYGEWMTPAMFRVNVENDPPTAPTLSAPADNSAVDTFTPRLVVNNASDPDSTNLTYNFELALDRDFAQIVESQTGIFEGQVMTSWHPSTGSGQEPLNLDENTWYYWRAQADDWLIKGPWMTPAKFFINTANDAPSSPVIVSPLNNTEVSTLHTDIIVSNSIDPDSAGLVYIFEMDTSATFDSSSLIKSDSIHEGQGVTIWSPLTGSGELFNMSDNTFYHVRAKANDGSAESPWSEVARFFVNTQNDAPTAPVLSNPSDGAGINTFTPTLSVHNSSDIDGDVLVYEFELYADAAMTNLIEAISGVEETADITSWTAPATLAENGVYYWRARAYDGELHSSWTSQASFMVNTANDAPTAPVLYFPAEGSSLDRLNPVLSVSNAEDPDSDNLFYEFEIYSKGALIQSINGISEDNSGITSIAAGNLSDNTTYTWRARAYDGDRYGAWMDMATFSIHLPVTNITATIDFDPNTLNQKSKGNWVTVYIELPSGYRAADIAISSIRLNGTIRAESWPYNIGDYDRDGIPDLMVKFKRAEVISLLPNGDNVQVLVTGTAAETAFEGVDVIRVIH